MVDVVGLRFVSEGGEKAVQDLNKYKNAQNDLASATQKNITFSQRNAAQLRSVAQAYASGAITLREAGNLTEDLAQRTTALARAAGATDAQIVSLVQRFNEMADAALSAARAQEAAADYERRIAAQMAFNEQLGVSGKLATEMGASFTQFATVLDNLDASARQFTSDLNERLGVTGQRAVETGASFSQFTTVLDNLDASARRFTSDLNDRLGVTGQRAVETGASFSQFATVLDNLDAAARRFTSDLNARLGVTGQRAIETGASFSQFATILDNLDAAARQFTTDLNQRLGVTGQRATQAGASFSQFAAVLDNIEASARRFTSELNDRLGVTGQRAIQAGAGYEALEADIRSAETALKNFQASFDPTAAAARRLENAQTVLANAVRTGAITQEESNRIMQQYRGALDDTAKSNEILRRETQALAMAYNPVMAAQIAYERKQQELNRAHELGVISADKLQAELAQLTAAYNSIGGSTLNAQRFTNQFGENVRIAGIKTNRFGMVAQQVGYQVGDFFVQIQSGTNVFVAFGQQATQLAGLLPGLAGAVVGISISVGTMLLGAWDRARRAQDEAAASVKNLQTELESLDQTLQNWDRTKKASEMGVTVEELIGAEGLDKAIADLEKAQQGLVPGQAQVLQNLARRGFAGLQEAENMFAYRSEEVEAYLEALRRVFALQKKINSESISSLEERVSIEARALELMKVEAAYGSDSIQLLRAKNALELETLQAKLEQEIAVGGVTAEERRLVDAILDAVRQQNEMSEALHESESGLNRAADSGRNLADALREANAAMQSLSGFSAGLDKALAVSVAKVEALRRGANAAVAGSIAGMRVELESRAGRLVQSGVDRGMVEQMVGPEREKINQLFRSEQERVRLQESSRGGGGGGGGGAAREQEDYLAGLLAEAEQKRRLVGLTEEETRRQEILFELKKRELPLSDERIEQIIQTEAETRKLIEAEQRREQMMQTIEGNIKSAFMSMVDGSQSVEDAFRNMLRNILLAVYEQQVAAPAAKGISNFLSNIVSGFTGGITAAEANGGGWNNGVKFFANGGIVNSPTMFGHSGGLGVMGEAGPEAIMPLKRGPDGKLGVSGGGGALTVNVVMDPSTGALGAFVQDQAGQVVAKAAPQLAQYASKTMVDQRRRGGTMKAAFRG